MQLILTQGTGSVGFVQTTASQGWLSAAAHRAVLELLTPSLGLIPSQATLRVPVDALAAAAVANGCACRTPEVQTIRSCERSAGGYDYSLWLDGTESFTESLDLSVSSTYRRQTRSRWVEEIAQALSWVDTDQTRVLRAWLAESADAFGAEGYVDGLPISFSIGDEIWTKETSGGIMAECGQVAADLSGCFRD